MANLTTNPRLGELQPKIIVNDTSEDSARNGLITGRIVLKYEACKSLFTRKKVERTADLLVPLKLSIGFHGDFETRTSYDDGYYIKYRKHNLFTTFFRLQDAPFRAQAGQEYNFPFAVTAPALTRHNETMPPSFKARLESELHNVRVSIEYHLSVIVETPGIKLKIGACAPMLLDREIAQPPAPRPRDLRPQYFQREAEVNSATTQAIARGPYYGTIMGHISTHALRPHLPSKKFVFDIHCQTPKKYIYPGQHLNFRVSIRCNKSKTTVRNLPLTELDSFKASLVAITEFESMNNPLRRRQHLCEETLAQKLRVASPKFEAMGDDHGWSSTLVKAEPLGKHTSSFQFGDVYDFGKISRRYVIRIQMRFKVGWQTVCVHQDWPVIMSPEPHDAVVAPGRMAREVSLVNGSVALPTYDEATQHDALPEYRRFALIE